MKELKKLVEEGKIKYIGLSEASPEIIRKCHEIHPITCIQHEWSLGCRDIENDLVPVCKELGIGIVCYSPIARGIFSKTLSSWEDFPKDWRVLGCGYLTEDNFKKNLEIVNKVKEIAKRENVDVTALALAWLIRQGDNVVTIPGTTKIDNLVNNFKAVEVAESLSDDVFNELSELTKNGFIGDR